MARPRFRAVEARYDRAEARRRRTLGVARDVRDELARLVDRREWARAADEARRLAGLCDELAGTATGGGD